MAICWRYLDLGGLEVLAIKCINATAFLAHVMFAAFIQPDIECSGEGSDILAILVN